MIKNKHILKFFANASLLVFAFSIISLNAQVTEWPDITGVTPEWPDITGVTAECPEIVIDWISKA